MGRGHAVLRYGYGFMIPINLVRAAYAALKQRTKIEPICLAHNNQAQK